MTQRHFFDNYKFRLRLIVIVKTLILLCLTVVPTTGEITNSNVKLSLDKIPYHNLSQQRYLASRQKAKKESNLLLSTFIQKTSKIPSITQLVFNNSFYSDCPIEIICPGVGLIYSSRKNQDSGQYNIKATPNLSNKNAEGKIILSNLTSSVFSNTSNISIPAANSNVNGGGAADPYSSNISVSGLGGTITDINVKINGFSHTFPNDIAMLLVSPTGEKYILQSDVGGQGDVENTTYTFDDQASEFISSSGPFPANNSSVKPSSVGYDDLLPPPAPGQPYYHPAPALIYTLSDVFGGLNPNGIWKLFVFDFFAGNSGSISGGWALEITTNGGVVSPSIDSLNPSTRVQGSSNFELVVNGNNFENNAIVRWNGHNKATTFVSSSQLKAQILSSDIQAIGTYPLTVYNPQSGRSSNSVNFSVIGCSYSLNNSSQTVPVVGGNGTIEITTTIGCTWTATSNNSWITVTSGNSGAGNGTVSFSVPTNTGPARTGTITIGGQIFTVNQGSGCNYSLSNSTLNFAIDGGAGSFSLNSGVGCPWTVQSNNSWITITSPINSSGSGDVNFSVAANDGHQRTGSIAVAGQLFTINQTGSSTASGPVSFDFDGDEKADISVYRPSNGVWHLLQTQQNYRSVKFGLSTDKLAPADYDGDGKTDIAIWRENAGNANFAYFYIMKSTDNTVRVEQFGSQGDSPKVVGDWDGDGKADLSVYRKGVANNSQSYFFYRPSSQPEINFRTIQWGMGNDKPVAADFDGDGRFDAAVYRPSEGVWYVQKSTGGNYSVQFGISEDKIVVGDYDGDGKADQAVFRPSNGIWYILGSSSGFAAAPFGIATDLPVPADYDGDGKTDIAIYRQGTWYQLNSTNGFKVNQFGISSDIPIPGFIVD